MARNNPEQTLVLTLEEDNQIVGLAEVGAMTKRAETSLIPKSFPNRVTDIPPDEGELDAFKYAGLERLYESVKFELACCDPDETTAEMDRPEPATHLDTIPLSDFQTMPDAIEYPKRAKGEGEAIPYPLPNKVTRAEPVTGSKAGEAEDTVAAAYDNAASKMFDLDPPTILPCSA